MSVVQKVGMRGCFRIQLGEDIDGKHIVVHDSGWCENEIVNLGVQDYLIDWLGAGAGGKAADTIIIATGTDEPASNATGLTGTTAQSGGTSSIVASRTFQITNAWASGDHPGGTPDIGSAGLADQGTGSYTIFCGNTFASSTWNSNQALSITYQVQFPTS
jgi:hypothetical protein